MIIGITGTDGAGKGSVVEYLVEKKGFIHCSARAIWEEEFKKRGMESNRPNMRLVANDLRKQCGNDFLVKYYLNKLKDQTTDNVVIESIRTLAEAETLKANGGILLAVDADQKIRYERILKRQSSSDHVSFEEFVEQEKLEMNDPDPHGMQKAKVMEMADYTVDNAGTFEDLEKEVDKFLEIYLKN